MKGFDSLLGEISKKKLEAAMVLKGGGSGGSGGKKKYFKRKDLEKSREDAYWEKEEKERIEKEKKRLKIERDGKTGGSEVVDLKGKGCVDTSKKEAGKGESEESLLSGAVGGESGEGVQSIDNEEVIRRLRVRGEPILLFGETERKRLIRLRKMELKDPEGRGQANEFKNAIVEAEQELMESILKRQDANGGQEGSDSYMRKAKEMNMFDEMKREEIEKTADGLGNDVTKDQMVVVSFLKHLLNLWKKELDERTKEEKLSVYGKNASATYKQTITYLNPFFELLQKNELDHNIVRFVVEIVKQVMLREYVKANDAYLRLSIGNAPWPIGVTMVGIHARTGRERIFSNKVGHVLNDEVQRKYIQGLKRLMTFAQRNFTTLPSKCVEFVKE
eukprot:Nk52_evm104s221 gene=Nk52_evmTU104s221